MECYVLIHRHVWRGETTTVSDKLLGIFSSYANVTAAIATYRALEGFSDSPDGYIISRFLVDASRIDDPLLLVDVVAEDEDQEDG